MIGRTLVLVLAAAMALSGAALAVGGFQLISAGGSWYYLPAGIALIATAAGLALRKPFAFPLFGALLAATLVWALWEGGLDGWALVPRILGPGILGLILLVPFIRRQSGTGGSWWVGLPVLAIGGTLLVSAYSGENPPADLKGAAPVSVTAEDAGEWKVWGRTLSGTRFSPLGDITTGNVAKLELAWEFKSDVEPYGFHGFEATPIAADGKLFVCLDRDILVALDEETGRQAWRFDPKSNLEGVFGGTCRGVSYYEAPVETEDCAKRILYGVHDWRLMAVDAETGERCRSFGENGEVDMKDGMGEWEPGIAYPSSPPTIVNGVAMISGWITDGLRVKEPSGGIRAYDAVTGEMLWMWDSGRENPQEPLKPGETYTPGAPNAWGVFSGDEELGLVYMGMGVETPDYFGAHRAREAEIYSTAIVALDVQTGKPRWHFQTVHHDIWDYDIASQPVLADIPVKGKRVPALIGPTKRGEFFVLDRRTGEPLYPVTEKPVPQDSVKEDWTARTQPYSSFPNVAGGKLTERQMWGATPFDQLWCRLQFRKARYQGDFTPPGTTKTIFYPGSAGGSNWGSVTIDTARDLMVTNSLYMADIGRLIPRAEADRAAAEYAGGDKPDSFAFPQQGTPYAMDRTVFLGPLGIPCQQPPFGRLSVIDLKTGKMVWTKPLGTAERAGPMGLELKLPIRMGVPNFGGSTATAGGVVFIAATQDRVLRAVDIGNGRELWRYSLPAIGAATPMTFRSSKSGRQFVVISAGGHPALPGPSDSSVLAFALPEGQ
ncbi:MAG: membrane-bound PQQ-dependent dehydrogenase, glucose/quinate/shikimate family [Novosphingobium sp.]|nr:membrane-bound PQQ-dependent dehydrogenase, glucose/quinate/shikimate family [Novosphingobium sp.]MCP5403018.1 membrane-bound PQQ-dependent dehydrogenase, glucose/quinate/shikimate family [Novosphingobium sp.]